MGRCCLCTDYETYLCQRSVLLITNVIGLQTKQSLLFDELLMDELKADVRKGHTVYTEGLERHIYLYFHNLNHL